jgi:hypothetical protein
MAAVPTPCLRADHWSSEQWKDVATMPGRELRSAQAREPAMLGAEKRRMDDRARAC